jgi:hypothetical protein
MRIFSGMIVKPQKPAQPSNPKTLVPAQAGAGDRIQFSGKRRRPVDEPVPPNSPPPKRPKIN